MILVTEANRTVSRELVPRLVQQGHAVRALVSGDEGVELLSRAGADVVRADPNDGRAIDAAMVGVGRLFLPAAGAREPVELFSPVIESAVRAGVRHVVTVTRAGDDREPAAGVARMRELGARVTELRITLTMQSLLALVRRLDSDELHAPLGVAAVAWIDARDVADAAAHCFAAPDRLEPYYDLTGPELMAMAEALALVSGRLGRALRYVSVAPERARRAWVEAGVDPNAASELLRAFKLAAIASGAKPSRALRQLLGREPRSWSELLSEHAPGLASA